MTANDGDKEQQEEELSAPPLDSQSIDWRLLPPLRPPRDEKRTEFYRGACIFGGGTIGCVIAVHGVALSWIGVTPSYTTGWWTFLILIYVLAIMQILFLFVMYYKDPGVVQRSSTSCFPIPSEVEPHIRSYLNHLQQQQSLEPTSTPPMVEHDNIVPPPAIQYIQNTTPEEGDNQDGTTTLNDTYCVRCLVWRRGRKEKYFHCRTCNRCVGYYDHHCGVFGRCIAGTGFPPRGNMPYFYFTITTGILMYVTAAMTVVWSMMVWNSF